MAEASQLRRVGDWVLQSVVGQGSFAVVWKATSATSAAAAAVKEIDTEKLNKKLKESLACEIAVLEQTKHQKNIVSLLDIIKVSVRCFVGAASSGRFARSDRHNSS